MPRLLCSTLGGASGCGGSSPSTCAAACATHPSRPSSSKILYQFCCVCRRAKRAPWETVARIACVLSGPARTTVWLTVIVSVSVATAALASPSSTVITRIVPSVSSVIDLLLLTCLVCPPSRTRGIQYSRSQSQWGCVVMAITRDGRHLPLLRVGGEVACWQRQKHLQ